MTENGHYEKKYVAILKVLSCCFFTWKKTKQEASQILQRVRRGNTFLEEMTQNADFERECVEEDCDQDELYETADGLPDNDKYRKWEKYEKCKEILRDEYRGRMNSWKNKQLPECMADEDQCASNPCDQVGFGLQVYSKHPSAQDSL